jgi:prepilin-type N-terminal cleavage/methylation domain-containing protein
MRNDGFSLMELLIAMGISGILLAIGGINFADWIKKGRVETQVKQMYSDIQDIRSKAAYTKEIYKATFSPTSMVVRRYTDSSDTTGTLYSTKTLDFPVTLSTWTNPAADVIEFDSNGFSSAAADPKLLCVYSSYGPAYDTVIVMQAKTSMGQLVNQGGGCDKNNVAPK